MANVLIVLPSVRSAPGRLTKREEVKGVVLPVAQLTARRPGFCPKQGLHLGSFLRVKSHLDKKEFKGYTFQCLKKLPVDIWASQGGTVRTVVEN